MQPQYVRPSASQAKSSSVVAYVPGHKVGTNDGYFEAMLLRAVSQINDSYHRAVCSDSTKGRIVTDYWRVL